MGTVCAPAYANIFMANFELKCIYPYIKDRTKMFLRFIDDLFMIMDRLRTRTARLHEGFEQETFFDQIRI